MPRQDRIRQERNRQGEPNRAATLFQAVLAMAVLVTMVLLIQSGWTIVKPRIQTLAYSIWSEPAPAADDTRLPSLQNGDQFPARPDPV